MGVTQEKTLEEYASEVDPTEYKGDGGERK